MARLDSSGSPRLLGQEGLQTARLMVYMLLAVVLMAMDQRGQFVPRIRTAFSMLMEPVFHVVDWPSKVVRSVQSYSRSLDELLDENRRLAEHLRLQSADLQRLAALRQENKRLRELLDATAGRKFGYRFAEMIQVSLDPFSHQVVIDRGRNDGVFEGQAVIDGAGIMGQVESVLLHMAMVRLISDPDHALPVQSGRTGLRTVAFGTGSTESLLLPNVPLQADVRAGDLLETSGLGERFPPGFPVAVVATVRREKSGTFARVTATPLAALDRGREVLLVVPVDDEAQAPRTGSGTAADEVSEERP